MKDNSKRAKNAILLIWIIFFINFLRIIFDAAAAVSLKGVSDYAFIQDDFFDVWYFLVGLTWIAYFIFFIISAIIYIQWFRRAYFNLHCEISDLKFTENWAAIGWFIPILNWFRPYSIMTELYIKSILF